MRITSRPGALFAIAALLIGAAFLFHGIATAGDEVPASKPEAKAQPITAEKPATATPSPMHSVMKWIGAEVMPGAKSPCPSTEAGEKAWRSWFAAKDARMSGLRNALVADGWNADRFVGFFQKMAASKTCGDCSECPESCDKAKSGASAPTGDAGKTGSSSCDGSGCAKKAGKSCCGGCDKAKGGASAPTGDAGKTGSSSCDGSGCAKKSGKCGGGGCDKAKSGASAPTGDAGETGSASPDAPCPCTGKKKSECEGCDKAGCDCGK